MWFAEYDIELYNDAEMVVDIDDSSTELQSSEASPQLNHVYNDKVNGDIENDLEAASNKPMTTQNPLLGSNSLRRQSSVGAAGVGPVNGLKTHEHNIILQRMAIVEVKKPGKGNVLRSCESIITLKKHCYVPSISKTLRFYDSFIPFTFSNYELRSHIYRIGVMILIVFFNVSLVCMYFILHSVQIKRHPFFFLP